jgi:uncharacterized repeat protein (TIGR02543 family)
MITEVDTMKKLFAFVLTIVMLVGMFSTTVFAATGDIFRDYDYRVQEHKRLLENERKDEYALSFYSLDFEAQNRMNSTSIYESKEYKTVQKVTAGITDEYEQAKAVAQWLFENVSASTCEAYAAITMNYFRLAGFPAKSVGGASQVFGDWVGHRWNHVFVDGRWVFVDTMVSMFDPAVEEWSKTHILSPGSLDTDWDGTITIYDRVTQRPIQTVGPISIGTALGDIKGLNIAGLYLDATSKYPVKATDKFSAAYKTIWTKTHSVTFYVPAGKGIEPFFVKVDADGSMYAELSVPHGAKLPVVKIPTKDGYTFIGWRELYNDKAPIWNENTDVVTRDIALIAVFQKGTVNYTVTFNSNGGSAVKSATVKANAKVVKPADPVKSGYKFTGWYLDSACTEPWDFSNIVNKNITLYAGWEKVINANPTTSKFIVNGKEVVFEAYNINGNNYFKLRDFAQAVNNTEKNFEVKWDGAKNAINLISKTPYTPVGGELSKGDGKAKVANPTTSKVYKDGVELVLSAYNVNGNNYFKLRDMAKAFDTSVTWDGALNTIVIDTSKGYVEE